MTAFLTLVTESLEAPLHAAQLGGQLCSTLGTGWVVQSVEPYPKFEASYKIDLACTLEHNVHAILEGIRLTDKIASPWSVYYDDEADTAELIFNKTGHTQYRHPAFEVIRWAHWQVAS